MREYPGRVARGVRERIFGSSRKIAFAPERTRLMGDPTPRAGLAKPLRVAAAVTLVATALSYLLPEAWAATGVGFTFLLASYWLVVGRDNLAEIRDFGLSLGGLLEPAPLEGKRLLREGLQALATAGLTAALIFPWFWFGFRIWWKVEEFQPAPFGPVLADALGQLLVIALPEEAFYRGYLQTSFDRALGRPYRLLGANIGFGLPLASAIFAVGHLLTEVNLNRLAVFFPALVFGLLRARTSGIGASIVFHALCNLFASYLLHSYGLAR